MPFKFQYNETRLLKDKSLPQLFSKQSEIIKTTKQDKDYCSKLFNSSGDRTKVINEIRNYTNDVIAATASNLYDLSSSLTEFLDVQTREVEDLTLRLNSVTNRLAFAHSRTAGTFYKTQQEDRGVGTIGKRIWKKELKPEELPGISKPLQIFEQEKIDFARVGEITKRSRKTTVVARRIYSTDDVNKPAFLAQTNVPDVEQDIKEEEPEELEVEGIEIPDAPLDLDSEEEMPLPPEDDTTLKPVVKKKQPPPTAGRIKKRPPPTAGRIKKGNKAPPTPTRKTRKQPPPTAGRMRKSVAKKRPPPTVGRMRKSVAKKRPPPTVGRMRKSVAKKRAPPQIRKKKPVEEEMPMPPDDDEMPPDMDMDLDIDFDEPKKPAFKVKGGGGRGDLLSAIRGAGRGALKKAVIKKEPKKTAPKKALSPQEELRQRLAARF